MTPEARVKLPIVRYLSKFVPDIWFLCVQDRFTSGIPDIIGVYHGKMFVIEVKRRGGKARRLQALTCQRIIKAGGYALVADTLKQVEDFLKEMRDA